MAERVRDYHPSAIDVLDRVLDKGIVIDGWWKISLAGVNLMSIDGRIVVASIETYLRHAPVLARTNTLVWPELEAVRWSAPVSAPASPPPAPASPPPSAPIPAAKRRRVRAR